MHIEVHVNNVTIFTKLYSQLFVPGGINLYTSVRIILTGVRSTFDTLNLI